MTATLGHRTASEGRRRAATPPAPERSPRRPVPPAVAWCAALLLTGAVLVADRVHPLPAHVAPAAAAALGLVLVVGLVIRTGGRPAVPVLLGTAYAVVAVATARPVLLGGAAVGVGMAAAVLSVMGTVPAVTFRRAIGEVVGSCLLATFGGLAVASLARPVGLDVDRFGYLVLALSLLGCLALVYRLGAGFHGLGRRGYVVAAGATVLLAVALAYSEALGRWGSPALISGIDDLRMLLRDHAGAVPHPIETLLGVPALCWGSFMRARRRQGWWVCAFGAAVTAPATTRFLMVDGPRLGVHTVVLGAAYSLVLGLVIGFVLVRADQLLTGSRGRRARRDEEAAAHRPEPGRFRPLQ
ncbi:MAG: hypothetical protein ACTHNS_06540 [Marmoricola sp.]